MNKKVRKAAFVVSVICFLTILSSVWGVNEDVIAFYFPWYETPQADGRWFKWNSNKHNPGKGDISSFFFPKLGIYSSQDPDVLEKHMKWMKRANIGVVVVSWWGQGDYTDIRMLEILEKAQDQGLKVTIMRDYRHQNPQQFKRDVKYIFDNYAHHTAFWKMVRPTKYSPDAEKERPIIFQWKNIPARPKGDHYDWEWRNAYDEIRKKYYSSIIVPNATEHMSEKMDTWHADGLMIWATVNRDLGRYKPWVEDIHKNRGIACLATSPGFNNTRHQPQKSLWKVESRKNGRTYDSSWSYAKKANPDFINITSFNGWNESHQIEPARGKATSGFRYLNYKGAYNKKGGTAQLAYIDRTSELSQNWKGYEPLFVKISNVEITNISDTKATITWTSSEGSRGQIEYGFTKIYGNWTSVESSRTREHRIVLKNLLPNTTYHFRTWSRRIGYIDSASSDHTVRTPKKTPIN
jgi:glycoprotein endo-alpha-1,2-mannosidase